MITFVPCNIFERIQYSEFILVRISLDEIKNLNLSGNEISTKRPIDSDETEKSATKRFSLSLPAPKNTLIDDRTDKGKTDKTEQVEENDEKEKSPQKKVLKRRNLAIYTTNDDETE